MLSPPGLGWSRQDVQLRTLLCQLHGAQLWGINFSFSTLGSFCVGSPISKAARALGAFCRVCWSLLVQKPKMRLPRVVVASCVRVRPLFLCEGPFDVVAGSGFECRNMTMVTPGSMEPWCLGEWAVPLSCRATGTSLPAQFERTMTPSCCMQWSKLLRPVVLAYVLWLAQALGFPGPVVLACVPLLADCRLGKAADLVGVDTVVLCLTSNGRRCRHLSQPVPLR